MKILQGINRVDNLDANAIRREAEQAGYTVFVLPKDSIKDVDTFFNAVRATFPLDPPLISSKSWDALSDSLWEGLHTYSAQRITILWPKATRMASSAPAEFKTALSVFTQISNLLADPRATCGNPKELAVLVEW